MNDFTDRLEKLARQIDEAKGLDFLGLAHRIEAPDRWDLLVSSPELEPGSIDALRYVDGQLKKALTTADIISIARIVVLPRNHEVLAGLSEDECVRRGKVSTLNDGRFDRVLLIRPLGSEHAAAGNGKRA